jgi:hypothetical protein
MHTLVPYPEGVCNMKIVTPLRLGVCGGFSFATGLFWFAIWYRSERDVLRVMSDVHPPFSLRLLVIVSFWVVVASVIWAMAIWLRGRKAKAES